MLELSKEEYEELIEQGLQQYEDAMKKKSQNAQKKLKEVAGYIACYEMLAEDEQTRTKLQTYQKQMNQIKTQGVRSDNKVVGEGFNDENERAQKALRQIDRDLEQGISAAEQIERQLNEQIEALDDIYEQNLEGKARLKRIQQSLKTILRRIYKDKLTCALLVLTVLGIIALIVVHFVHTKK